MQQHSVFVFDLDGVITDPQDSSVDTQAVGYIAALLNTQTPVAINTGRSYNWVRQNLLATLEGSVSPDAFAGLYVVCEKGGESLLWQGTDFELQPSRFALDEHMIARCKQVFARHQKDFDTMFWDKTKRTMATIEKLPQADLSEFHRQQKQLVAVMNGALAGKSVRVDSTTVATDVELPGAGKHAGAELISEWALRRGMASPTFTCFGDSTSDYEMARCFATQGSESVFVFVGKPTDTFDIHPEVRLIRTHALYAAGVREYFLANPVPAL